MILHMLAWLTMGPLHRMHTRAQTKKRRLMENSNTTKVKPIDCSDGEFNYCQSRTNAYRLLHHVDQLSLGEFRFTSVEALKLLTSRTKEKDS